MTTKDYLKQLARFESLIERKENEVTRLDIMAHSIKSPTYDPNKVQTSLEGDKLSSSVAMLLDAEKQVRSLVSFYLQKRQYIISQIDAMPDHMSYIVLYDKYVEHKSNCEIAYKLKYSERWVKKAHAKAIKEFEALYGEEYLDNPTIFC